jgi:tRNA(fMet)-specific endonuclease VapC
MVHLDTSFLVDLLRSKATPRGERARALLARLGDEEVAVSVHVMCELHAGIALCAAPDRERTRVASLVSLLSMRYPDERFAPTYGDLLATLQRKGETVAALDLLIGTAAVVDKAPIITANARHFSKIPGLRVESY